MGTIIFEHSENGFQNKISALCRTRTELSLKKKLLLNQLKRNELLIYLIIHKFEKSNGEHFKAKSYSKAIVADINDSELTHENLLK